MKIHICTISLKHGKYSFRPFGSEGINLLNQAREKLEQTVDKICESTGEKKPRMYRKRARRDFLRLSKSKKRSAKAIRSASRKQLQYIRRDVGYIVQFVQNDVKLTEPQKNRMNLVTTVYERQRLMLESGITAFHGESSVWPSPGYAPLSGERPMPTLNLGRSCTSVW